MLNAKYLILILPTFFISCTSLRTVDTNSWSSASTPSGFKSPLEKMERAYEGADSLRLRQEKINFRSKSWFQYTSAQQAYSDSYYEQQSLEDQFEKNQSLPLERGQSYSFDLESFCIDPHSSSPGENDGLTPASFPKEFENWLPQILAQYKSVGLSQAEAQTLIWALVSDANFNELSTSNQIKLLKIFPDAAIRFSKRQIENLAESALFTIFPNMSNTVDQLREVRSQFIRAQDDFNQLKSIMVSPAKPQDRVEPQWFSNNGVLIRLRADGYSLVHLELYVPLDNRSPQSVDDLLWSLSKLMGTPNKGQRLAISPHSRSHPKPQKHCEDLSQFQPKNCHEMSDEDRAQILKLADPSNFPNTRYGAPDGPDTAIEELTDCSHFTEEIYRRAGFEYPYASTQDFSCLTTFAISDMDSARPADLVLYDGHVGIYDVNGNVISATTGGPRHASMGHPGEPGFKPSIQAYKTDTFPHLKGVLKWQCPK